MAEEKSLCDSCGNIQCIMQAGIVRTKCDFYIEKSKRKLYEPCLECFYRYGHGYSESCDDKCSYAMAIKELNAMKGKNYGH